MLRPTTLIRLLCPVALSVMLAVGAASAQSMRIPLPKRTKPTPVQKLNRDGVAAVQKHDFEKARKLFYRAYLIDPNDPFTLNNLGYIAEIDGEIERAQRFYQLAAENASDAVVERAGDSHAEGRTVASVVTTGADTQMQINRINVRAIGLLSQDRAPEADVALQGGLKIEPDNPFTLNNLGYAKEKEGEIEQALRYYTMAANRNSTEPVVVTLNHSWRGQSISKVAAENARKARKQLSREEDTETKVARLNLRAVSAINRNERPLALGYFKKAYQLDPQNAFTLNNMGYLSELEGDRETANYYYSRAQNAPRSEAKVALATRRDAEGERVGWVAASNDQSVATAQETARAARQREGGTVALRRRDRSFVTEPATAVGVVAAPRRRGDESEVRIPVPRPAVPRPSASTSIGQPAAEPTKEVVQPLPENQQPQAQPTQDVLPPLPDNQQPQGQPTQDVVPPLPDNQQPNVPRPPH